MHTRANRNGLIRQRLTRTAVLIGLTLAGTLGAAPVAQAGQSRCSVYAPGGQNAATACFDHEGEKVQVCDRRADGQSAVGRFNGIEVWASGGAGNCVDRNLSIVDGTWVWVQACVGERARPNELTCGAGVWAQA